MMGHNNYRQAPQSHHNPQYNHKIQFISQLEGQSISNQLHQNLDNFSERDQIISAPIGDSQQSPIPDEEQTVDLQIISQMREVGMLKDSHPIRTACFSPNSADFFVIGTNSKSLKFCRLSPNIINQEADNRSQYSQHGNGIEVIYEQFDHHNGSIYCVDWSRTSRLVATGSNDKMIKILVTPNFEDEEKD